MQGTPSPANVSTKLQRIAELAPKAPDMVFTSLAHHIDLELLQQAYRQTRKDGAPGIDGQTSDEYAANLQGNLQALLDRFKSGGYQAPPVRRVHIPKGDGKSTRPIGIPTFEGQGPAEGGHRWCWRRCTSRTFWTARTASDLAGQRTRRWKRFGEA
jgi:hypothetical protein